MSSRCEVVDTEGRPLFTVRKELFSSLPEFCAEDPKGNKFFGVPVGFSCQWSFRFVLPQACQRVVRKKKSTATFLNAADRKQITLKMKGDFFQSTTEIKLGDSDTVVARIDRELLWMGIAGRVRRPTL